MFDNYFQRIYCIIIVFLASVMIVLITLLFFEYRFFSMQAQELVVIKQRYYSYVDELQKKKDSIAYEHASHQPVYEIDLPQDQAVVAMTEQEISLAQDSDDPDDDDEYLDDSFVIINRQPEYLKQSAVDYLQDQELSSLLTTLDINQWSCYTDEKASVIPEKKLVNPATKPAITLQRKVTPAVVKKPLKDFGLVWPIDKDKFWLSSLFGPRKRIDGTWGFHHGIDMAAVKGTSVKSASAGRIIEASFQAGYGNTVVVQHTTHVKTRYAHLHTICVRNGQTIRAGAVVGTVGETGFIRKKGKDGSHLHFEVYEKGKRINPLDCLPRSG